MRCWSLLRVCRHLRDGPAHLSRRFPRPGQLSGHPGARVRRCRRRAGQGRQRDQRRRSRCHRPDHLLRAMHGLPHRAHQCVPGTLKLLGVDLDGGFGQLVAVPTNRILPLPDAIPMEDVPMVELYSIGQHTLERGHVQPAWGDGRHPGRGQGWPLHPGRPVPQRQPGHDRQRRPVRFPAQHCLAIGSGAHGKHPARRIPWHTC